MLAEVVRIIDFVVLLLVFIGIVIAKTVIAHPINYNADFNYDDPAQESQAGRSLLGNARFEAVNMHEIGIQDWVARAVNLSQVADEIVARVEVELSEQNDADEFEDEGDGPQRYPELILTLYEAIQGEIYHFQREHNCDEPARHTRRRQQGI